MLPLSRTLPRRAVSSALLATAAGLTGSWAPVAAMQSGNGGGLGPEVTLAAARVEVEAGRNWHAAEILLDMRRASELPPGGLLLLAQARAGFRDWNGVREILLDAPWIASVAPVEGAVLLGRAYEAAGEWEAAASRFRAALERAPEGSFPLRARLARAELRSGRLSAALAVLTSLDTLEADPLLSSLAWELARWGAEVGDSAAVAGFLPFVQNRGLRERAADYYPRAVLAEGDSARAESLFRALLESDPGPRAPVWRERVATLSLARGDTADARELFRETLLEAGRTAAGMESARRLVMLGGLDRDLALRAARALDRLGDGARALRAYDAYMRLSREEGVEADPAARVERARLASTVPSRIAEAVEEYRALDEHPDPAVGARVLELWAGLRRRQGQTENVRTLGRWLVERYPDTDQAAEVVFLRGDFAHDR
ncbi:MAG TPA: tetratricopeptide repeat protein, partial [Longimicrobiales bacterium]|nr:tetratricopeptide repeat protein [Longimicrobiales bacterium]